MHEGKDKRHNSIFKHLKMAAELLRMAWKALRKISPKYTPKLGTETTCLLGKP